MKIFKVMQTSFDNFDNSVRNYLSKVFNTLGMQYTHNQIFGVIFDGIKGILLNVMFYIEDAMTEQNIFTASRKKSILSLAKISGYEGYYGSAATGTVNIRLKNNNATKTSKIYVKNHTSIVNESTNIKYLLDLPVDYYIVDVTKPLITHEFKVIEGFFSKAQFSAKGYILESFAVYTQTLFDVNYITVYVNGEKWNQVTNLYEMGEKSHDYMIQVGYDNSFDVIFGNGTYGSILPEGTTVTVEYLCHNGILGNIDSNVSAKLTFDDEGYDKDNDTLDINEYLQIELPTFITGGTSADSISKIRTMVGYNSRSLVLANELNFEIFLKRFSFVGNSNIWSEKNSMTITSCILQDINKKIHTVSDYFNFKDEDLILTEEHKEMIRNVLDNSKRAFAGVTILFVDPVIRRFAVFCYIKTDGKQNKESIISKVTDVIGQFFIDIPHNTTFISKSDIIKTVLDKVEGLVFFDLNIISDLAEKTFKNGYYDKYSLEYVNGTYIYKTKKTIYEPDTLPGLDSFGNILLDTKLEVPILSNGISYFGDKTNKEQNIKIEAVNCYFI